MSARYKVERCDCGSWCDAEWTIDDGIEAKPQRFDTEAEANAAIDEMIADVKDSVAKGYMESEYDRADFRAVLEDEPKTSGISMWEEPAERDRTETAWEFWLLGKEFHGYAYNEADAFSDAERILEGELDGLTVEQMGECYRQLVGYDPLKEPDVGPAGRMTGDQLRELLFDVMCKP
jgi:hypothetical protein